MKTPDFWYDRRLAVPLWAQALEPLYLLGRAAHMALMHPVLSPLYTICIGNAVAGGGGKTPVVRALAALLTAHHPAILSRGYGGTQSGPHWVHRDDPAEKVGDEALLLARTAPTMIAKNRLDGARPIAQTGTHDLILMDDGLQNRTLAAQMNIVVIDGAVGFGNGRCLPAGPLREALADLWPRVQGLILVGDDRTDIRTALPPHLPVFTGQMRYDTAHLDLNARYMAVAGLARPQKFFDALAGLKMNVVDHIPLPDHTPYPESLRMDLKRRAAVQNARVITTEKDAIKWPDPSILSILPQNFVFDAPDQVVDFVTRGR